MIGRSHGIHAEPTTFGLKMALMFDEFGRAERRLKDIESKWPLENSRVRWGPMPTFLPRSKLRFAGVWGSNQRPSRLRWFKGTSMPNS